MPMKKYRKKHRQPTEFPLSFFLVISEILTSCHEHWVWYASVGKPRQNSCDRMPPISYLASEREKSDDSNTWSWKREKIFVRWDQIFDVKVEAFTQNWYSELEPNTSDFQGSTVIFCYISLKKNSVKLNPATARNQTDLHFLPLQFVPFFFDT